MLLEVRGDAAEVARALPRRGREPAGQRRARSRDGHVDVARVRIGYGAVRGADGRILVRELTAADGVDERAADVVLQPFHFPASQSTARTGEASAPRSFSGSATSV